MKHHTHTQPRKHKHWTRSCADAPGKKTTHCRTTCLDTNQHFLVWKAVTGNMKEPIPSISCNMIRPRGKHDRNHIRETSEHYLHSTRQVLRSSRPKNTRYEKNLKRSVVHARLHS